MGYYLLGENPDMKEKVEISEEDLRKHMLIIGGAGKGKSRFFMHLAKIQMGYDRPLSIFDSKGDLYKFALGLFVEKNDKGVILADTMNKDWVLGFNPLERRVLPIDEQVDRMVEVCFEGAKREGLELAKYEAQDPIAGVLEIIGLVTRKGTYFQRSIGQKKNTVNFFSILEKEERFVIKIPRERGSYLYSMLLFNDFVAAAEYLKPQSLLHLVFVDEIFSFLSSPSIRALKKLTENRIALILSATYKQLSWLKCNYPSMYQTLLTKIGTISAFGGGLDEPIDILTDVAMRLQNSEN